MKKILTVLFVIISLFTIQANTYAASIDKTISASGINKGAVSVSVKDVKTGKTVYKLNENQPNMPASTLKMILLQLLWILSALIMNLKLNYTKILTMNLY